MLDTQRYFLSSARGEDAAPPAPTPPQVLSDDPVRDFNRVRTEMLAAFGEPGIIERPAHRSASPSATSCCTAGISPEQPGRTQRCRPG